MLPLRSFGLVVLFVACACGDDASEKDAAPDAPTDAPVDAPVDANGDATDADARPPIPDGALTIGTWNIEQLPKTLHTFGHVVDIVNEEQIDLLGVQEIVEPEDFEALVASAPGYASYAAFGRTPIRVGFMYRTERLEVTDVERLFLDDWWAFPRPVLKARILDLETGFDFVFLVLHLKARVDEESRMRRQLAIEALDAWLTEQLASGTEQDFVVVGDYNDELTDPAVSNVYRPILEAPLRYRFLTLPVEEAGGHSYLPFDSMIDHILVTSDALDEYGEGTTEVLPLERRIMYYEARVSDHRPVIARFVP